VHSSNFHSVRSRSFRPALGLVFLISTLCSSAQASSVLANVTQSKRVLGRTLSVSAIAESIPAGAAIGSVPGISERIQTTFLGFKSSLAKVTNQGGWVDVYLKGIKVWTGNSLDSGSGLHHQVTIPPTRFEVPVISYPIGPLLLGLQAGVDFSGGVTANAVPTDLSAIQADLEAQLAASGFIQGTGGLFFIRGGVDGRMDLIDGAVEVRALLEPKGQAPTAQMNGRVLLLKGSVEGFLESRLLVGVWNRLMTRTLFSSPGKCFSFGDESCLAP